MERKIKIIKKEKIMPETIRCFLAFDIENDEVLRKLVNIQKLLLNTGAALKIVKSENIHITMRFLGNISSNLIEKISNDLQWIDFNSFSVKLNGLGVFPKINHPRVVWVGITKGSKELFNIFDQIEPILQKLGFSHDFKGFLPHLTIARVKSPKNKEQLINLVKNKSAYNIGVIRIKSLKLKKSNLSSVGPIYSTIKNFYSKSEVQVK
jgi:2'-5' RNA ligase